MAKSLLSDHDELRARLTAVRLVVADRIERACPELFSLTPTVPYRFEGDSETLENDGDITLVQCRPRDNPDVYRIELRYGPITFGDPPEDHFLQTYFLIDPAEIKQLYDDQLDTYAEKLTARLLNEMLNGMIANQEVL